MVIVVSWTLKQFVPMRKRGKRKGAFQPLFIMQSKTVKIRPFVERVVLATKCSEF